MFLTLAGSPAKAEPTSLLNVVAGEFAPRVAALWPAPHVPFLSAPSARRHLVCLALTFGRDSACASALAGRLTRAIADAVPAPPHGLARALARMGDIAWTAADYRKLLPLLADAKAGKVLRHAATIEADVVRRLDTLPPPMAGATHLAVALNASGAAALREAYDALRLRAGPATADAAAARWAATSSVSAAFEAARHALTPEPLAPPHPGAGRLKPLATKRALRDAASRFRNCLADCAPRAATGWSAFYEWEGSPGAVVEICRDHVFGWRLDEVRAAGNAAVPEPVREVIRDELALMGVHVGRSGWELHRALSPDVGVTFVLRPLAVAADEAFVV